MNKNHFILLTMLVFSLSAFASGKITLKGTEYVVDTLFHAKIGPGTTQTSLKLHIENATLSKEKRIFYFTCDANTPNIKFKAVTGNDKLSGCERISSMAQRKTTDKADYFCGVNGDFYYTWHLIGTDYIGTPAGSMNIDGVPYITNSPINCMGVDDNNVPCGGVAIYEGVLRKDDITHKITGVNIGMANNRLVLYTPVTGGGSTMTDTNVSEVAVELISGSYKLGETCKIKVLSDPVSGVGNMTVPTNGFVLSGQDSEATFVNGLRAGDIYEMEWNMNMDNVRCNLDNLISGNPLVLQNGEVLPNSETAPGNGEPKNSDYPRTAAGYSADKSKIIFMVVDGKSSISTGVTQIMLGELLKYAGADFGMNWDGGGSAGIYTEAHGIRNVPCDGNERAVGNGMFVVYEGENKTDISEINFEDWRSTISQYGKYTPVIYGYNDGGVLKDTNLQGVTLTCDPEIGVISADGKSFLATKKGTGLLYASYNGATAKLVIDVTEAKDLHMRLDQVINNGVDDYPIEVLATAGITETNIDPTVLTWTSSDTNVATVTNGVLHGISNGKATITGTLGDFEGTLPVTVEIADGAKMKADALDMSTWTISGAGCSNFVTTNEGDGVTISYTSATNRSPYMKLAKDFYLYSIPKSFEITFESNITVTSVLAAVRPYAQTSQNYTINTTEPYNVVFDISTMVDNTKDMLYYPIQLSSLRFNFDKAAFVAGTENKLQIKSFVCNYDKFITSVSDPEMLSKLVVYPNPVKAGEQCMYYLNAESANVAIAVYSLDGKMVKSTEVKNAQAGNIAIPLEGLAPATYMVQIICNGKANTAKVIVL